MHISKVFQQFSRKFLRSHDQEVDIAGHRVKISQGERAVQVESNQFFAQDRLHLC